MSYQWQFVKKKLEAQQLRAEGFSIKSIEKKLHVARSTASLWCKDVKLTIKQQKALYWSARAGAWKGSIIAAKNKKAEKIRRLKIVADDAKKKFGALGKRDFFIGGISLYAGEGSKTGNVVQFTNTNPLLIKFMIKWLREYCRVPQEKLRGWVYIHQGSDEKKAKEFWSHLTGISILRFTKSYIAQNREQNVRKQIHPYGVFRVSVCDVALLHSIKTWIACLCK